MDLLMCKLKNTEFLFKWHIHILAKKQANNNKTPNNIKPEQFIHLKYLYEHGTTSTY